MNLRQVASQAALSTQRTVHALKTGLAKKKTVSKNASGLPNLRLRELVVAQSHDHAQLSIELLKAGPYLPTEIWLEHNQDFILLTELLPSSQSTDNNDAITKYRCELNIDEILSSLPEWTELGSNAPTGEEPEGHLIRVYLGYPGLPEELLGSLPTVTNSAGERIGLARLGRANRSEVGEFTYGRTGGHFYYPHVTRRGHLVIEVDREHRPYGKIRNDRLTFKDGRLSIRGRISARGTTYTTGELVVLGRTSGLKVTSPISLRPNRDRIAQNFGLKHYEFDASVDFRPVIGQIDDDNADLYLDLVPALGADVKRVRIGKSRYLVRAGSVGGSVSSAGKTVNVIPYYTFKAKNPSLYLETFETKTHELLQSRIKPLSVGQGSKSDRPVWLIGELPYKAQDNGLQFFKHMREHHPEIDAYYVIRSNSPEARNLEGYDHVVDFRSIEHIQVTLAADKIVGTHHPDFLYPTRQPEFKKALHADQVFLQHGVTAAKWMVPNYGKYVGGFDVDLVTVCSEREKQFFVKDFKYAPDQVAVTGFARFDNLFKQDVEVKSGQLMIMPTWRPWLQDPEYFTESDYFQRWRSLLTSDRFKSLMTKYSLEPVFCLHPNMQQYSSHFSDVGVRVVVQGEVDVQMLLKQSSMLVTDYSSVAFDFAFLHKPAAYYQFDDHRFAAPHAEPKSEFPGPVLADERRILDYIDEVYANDGRMSETYKARADRFISYRDTRSCERIFEAISSPRSSRLTMTDVVNNEFSQAAYRIARKQKLYLPTMKKLYKLMRLAPLNQDKIVFESGQGKQYGDSPRAIYEELVRQEDDRTKVWVYNKRIPNTDEHTIVVKRHSPGFFWHLATAKYWINNHNFPNYIHRRRHGEYVQTWHGTPLKRMFLDQDNFYGRDPGYIDRVKEASAQWSALVSPSPYATKAMQSSYGFAGPVYEIGYPRNDVLRGPHSEQIREAVRRRLSIAQDKTVVLYAPTFRDDQPTSRGRFSFDWPFSPTEFVDKLGDNFVLLVRTHVLVNTQLAIPEELRSNIIDVSAYPDIQELFLASDMLVTDYSSSFFDYSILERPIIFYAYDLENYRDNLRGFYLDYEKDVPGPIAERPEELFKLIFESKTPAESTKATLRSFADRFSPNDDGQASMRVIRTLLDGVKKD